MQQLYRAKRTLGKDYYKKVLNVAPSNLIGYWPLDEPNGSVAYNLAYTHNLPAAAAAHASHTGVTLQQPGIGDGRTSPYYDGANDYTNIYSAALAGAFNGAEGTLMAWAKVSGAGAWKDGTSRNLVSLVVDANNKILLRKSSTNNTYYLSYIAGGTSETSGPTSMTTAGWFCSVATWSKTAELCALYVTDKPVATSANLGTFAGSLASTGAVIGAESTTPGVVFSGTIAHVALWNTPLTAAQIAYLSRVK